MRRFKTIYLILFGADIADLKSMKKIILLIILCWQSTLFASGLKCENLFDSKLFKVTKLTSQIQKNSDQMKESFMRDFSESVDHYMTKSDYSSFFDSKKVKFRMFFKKLIEGYMDGFIPFLIQGHESDMAIFLMQNYNNFSEAQKNYLIRAMYSYDYENDILNLEIPPNLYHALVTIYHIESIK